MSANLKKFLNTLEISKKAKGKLAKLLTEKEEYTQDTSKPLSKYEITPESLRDKLKTDSSFSFIVDNGDKKGEPLDGANALISACGYSKNSIVDTVILNGYNVYLHVPKIPLVTEENWLPLNISNYIVKGVGTNEDIINKGDSILLKRYNLSVLNYITKLGDLDNPEFKISEDESIINGIKLAFRALGFKGSTDGDLIKFCLNKGMMYAEEDLSTQIPANEIVYCYGVDKIISKWDENNMDINLPMFPQPIRENPNTLFSLTKFIETGIYPYIYINDINETNDSNWNEIKQSFSDRLDLKVLASEIDNNGYKLVNQTLSDRTGNCAIRTFYIHVNGSISGSIKWSFIGGNNSNNKISYNLLMYGCDGSAYNGESDLLKQLKSSISAIGSYNFKITLHSKYEHIILEEVNYYSLKFNLDLLGSDGKTYTVRTAFDNDDAMNMFITNKVTGRPFSDSMNFILNMEIKF